MIEKCFVFKILLYVDFIKFFVEKKGSVKYLSVWEVFDFLK